MMKRAVSLNVNGEKVKLEVEPRETLLDVLRERLHLTGAKEGCGTGDCGACTVLVDDVPVLSCLTLAVECDGKAIITIEGLAKDGQLHPLQQAFIEKGALQCGFCTPGMILSSYSLLQHNPSPSRQEVSEAIAGNLCRCTGYVKIVDAVMAAARQAVSPVTLGAEMENARQATTIRNQSSQPTVRSTDRRAEGGCSHDGVDQRRE